VVSKACQTAGRIFRSRHKKGLVVFADSRYKFDPMQREFFYNCFPAYFKDRMIETETQQKFEASVSIFWGKLPSQQAETRIFKKN
jgi:Rad3-related DNA helicase